jgi:hypothetical protein
VTNRLTEVPCIMFCAYHECGQDRVTVDESLGCQAATAVGIMLGGATKFDHIAVTGSGRGRVCKFLSSSRKHVFFTFQLSVSRLVQKNIFVKIFHYKCLDFTIFSSFRTAYIWGPPRVNNPQ